MIKHFTANSAAAVEISTLSKLKCLAFVAPLAVGKVANAKSPFTVMTITAALRSTPSAVHHRERRRHLTAAGCAGADRMATRTAHFPHVFPVTEIESKGLRLLRRPYETTGFMTYAT